MHGWVWPRYGVGLTYVSWSRSPAHALPNGNEAWEINCWMLRKKRKWFMNNWPISTTWQLIGGEYSPLHLSCVHSFTIICSQTSELIWIAFLTTLGIWMCKLQDRKWKSTCLKVVKRALPGKVNELIDHILKFLSEGTIIFLGWWAI